MTAAVVTDGLGKRYRRHWALRDCTVTVPAGRVVGLVGPNGAGKSTLLGIAAGLRTATTGAIEVLGERRPPLPRVGYVAQDTPTYAQLTVADHLRLGARLNSNWDADLALERVRRHRLDPARRAGELSGGQRAQLALTIGLAKRPELLLLDEPTATLDPLARHEFLQGLMEAAADRALTIVLSSHLVGDLERVCDHLVVLADSRVVLDGAVERLLDTHVRLTGARRNPERLPVGQHLVAASHTDRQSTLLVRAEEPIIDPSWDVGRLDLEEIVLAYMRQQAPRPLELVG